MKKLFNLILLFVFIAPAYSEGNVYSCSEWKFVFPLKKNDPLFTFFKDKQIMGVPFIAKKTKNNLKIKDEYKNSIKLTYIGDYNKTGVSIFAYQNQKYNTIEIYSSSLIKKDNSIVLRKFSVNTQYTYHARCYP